MGLNNTLNPQDDLEVLEQLEMLTSRRGQVSFNLKPSKSTSFQIESNPLFVRATIEINFKVAGIFPDSIIILYC